MYKRVLGTFSAACIAISLVTVGLPAIGSAIPLYAEDYITRLVQWPSAVPLHPETVRLIQESAVVYTENQAASGDAGYFEGGDIDLNLYIGFGNLRYSGMALWLDDGNLDTTLEENFYHSCDPATFTAWRTAESVELRWTPDYRFVAPNDVDDAEPAGKISRYRLIRTGGAYPDTLYPVTTSCTDTNIATYDSYEYALESITDTGDTLSFSDGPAYVSSTVEDAIPHFYAAKLAYLEKIFYDSQSDYDAYVSSPFTALDWSVRFFVEGEVDSTAIQIEIYKSYHPAWNSEGVYDVYDCNSGVTFDRATGEIGLDLNLTSEWLKEYGGIVSRLRYGDIVFPADRNGKKCFVWPTINNRITGCSWPEYLPNPEGESWPLLLRTIANKLASVGGVNPDGGDVGVNYDNIFFDSVNTIGVGGHNTIEPYQYGGSDAYLSAIVDAIAGVGAEIGCYLNVGGSALIQRLDSVPGVRGIMDESLVHEDEGTIELADLMWLAQARSFDHILVRNKFDYADKRLERRQCVSAYLLSRDNIEPPGGARVLMGYGGGIPSFSTGTTVNIMPEQMIRVGDAVDADPFAGAAWPDSTDWDAATDITLQTIRSLQSIVPSLIDSVTVGARRHYLATREFYHEDGLPASDNTVFTAWHLGWDDTTRAEPVVFTIQELFPDKTLHDEYFRLVLPEQAISRLVEGATFTTEATAVTDPCSLSIEDAALFFSAPVSSPEVVPSSTTLSSMGSGNRMLAVNASHWNGQLLEIEVDATDIVWGVIELYDDGSSGGDLVSADSVYTYAGQTAPPAGSYLLPLRAKGTDGLLRYMDLAVDVLTDPVLGRIADAAQYAVERGGTSIVAVAVRDNGLASIDTVWANLTSLNSSVPVGVALLDDGVAPDQIPGDAVWTTSLIPTTQNDTTRIVVTAVDENGVRFVEEVRVDIIDPIGGLTDVSAATDALAKPFVEVAGQDVPSMPQIAVPFSFRELLGTLGAEGKDVVVALEDSSVQIFEYETVLNGNPRFQTSDDRDRDFASSVPREVTSLIITDLNNDGYEDIFLCASPSHPVQFLRYNPTLGEGKYEDATAEVFGAAIPKAQVAAWGDYTGDGVADLMLASHAAGWQPGDESGVSISGSGIAALSPNLFRTENGRLILDEPGFGLGVATASYTAHWCDYDLDGDADAFVGDFFGSEGGGSSRVIETLGYDETAGRVLFADVTENWFQTAPGSVIASEFLDLDGDQDGDLIIASIEATQNLAVYVQPGAPGATGGPITPAFEALAAEVAQIPPFNMGLSGVIVTDLDGNQLQDIVTLPYWEDDGPLVLMNGLQGVPNQFVAVNALDVSEQGFVPTGFAQDFNDDDRPELYFGRDPSVGASNIAMERFFYRNDVGSTGSSRKVRVVGGGMCDISALGSRIDVFAAGGYTTPIAPSQWVNGGGGRGGQRSRVLSIEPTQAASSVNIRVTWPDGGSTEFDDVALNQSGIVILEDPRQPAINSATITETKSLAAGTLQDWTFTWTADRPLAGLFVKINVDPYGTNGSECDCDYNDPIVTIYDGEAGSSSQITRTGSETYQHALTIESWCCAANCDYQYRVGGYFMGTMIISNWKIPTKIKSCLKELPPPPPGM